MKLSKMILKEEKSQLPTSTMKRGMTRITPPPNYPQGFQLGLIMIALCLSILLVALDNTILVTAIPKIVSIAFPKCNI